MKFKILVSAGIWLCLITLCHIWLNVGFTKVGKEFRILMGEERSELIVGFLPVT